MSESKVEVKKLVLSVRGKEIALTPDEAHELWRVLNEMYSRGTTWVPYPIPYYTPPYYWRITYGDGTVYCSGVGETTALSGGEG